MSLLFNQTDIIGSLIVFSTNNLTGSIMITFVGLILLFLMFLLAFRMPLELALTIILPFVLMFASFIGGLQLVLVLILAYLGVMFAKYFFI